MFAYIIRRILGMIPTLFIVSVITFIIILLPPGDYFTTLQAEVAESGGGPNAETVALLQERYGLDRPPIVQYFYWVSGFPKGDFGWSFEWSSPVLPLVLSRMAYTMLLGFFSLLFMVIIAIPIGIYSATHQYSVGDHMLSGLGFLGLSIPSFLLALVWMFFGIVVLRTSVGGVISPHLADAPMSFAKGLDYFNHLWPPAIILALAGTAQIQRIMRGNLLEEMDQPYITTARAKGLKRKTVTNKYGVRVAINPVISVVALEIPKIISASAIIGIVMSLPTTGPMFLRSLLSQDMYLAGTFLLFTSLLLLVSNLIADILLAWADPRISYS